MEAEMDLEGIKADSTFTVAEVLEEKINNLLSGMYTFKQLQESEEVKEIVEGWRHNLVALRQALREVLAPPAPEAEEE